MSTRITVRLSNTELGALRREAAATGQPQAEVMRRALSERAVLAEIERAVVAKVATAFEPVTQRLAAQQMTLASLAQRVDEIAFRIDAGATREDLIKATNYLAAKNGRAGGA